MKKTTLLLAWLGWQAAIFAQPATNAPANDHTQATSTTTSIATNNNDGLITVLNRVGTQQLQQYQTAQQASDEHLLQLKPADDTPWVVPPNEVNNAIKIVLPSNHAVNRYMLYDETGRLVRYGPITHRVTTLDMVTLPESSYQLALHGNGYYEVTQVKREAVPSQ